VDVPFAVEAHFSEIIEKVRSRFAVGLEWVKDLGDANKGASFGSNLKSPFAGGGGGAGQGSG